MKLFLLLSLLFNRSGISLVVLSKKIGLTFNLCMFFAFIGNIRIFFYCRYGRTNQRLGQLLIHITATFEDEFHELEVRFMKNYSLYIFF